MPSRNAPSIDLVVGTRPNIVKAAPLLHELVRGGWRCRLVFLAQHSMAAMTTQVFEDLLVPSSVISRITIDSVSIGGRFGEMVEKYADLLDVEPPSMAIVFGDVDATLAAAFAAKRAHLPVAHVEAGLRSGDMRMPEEINRKMVDSISDLYFTTIPSGTENLVRQGITSSRIHFCGNLMIDALLSTLRRCGSGVAESLLPSLGIRNRAYAVATFHRPSNVDSPEVLEKVVDLLMLASRQLPVVFPIHPRSARALEQHGLRLGSDRIKVIDPLRYSHFAALLSRCRLVITDSGGLQEESSALGIPCLTFRENTERPETVSLGTNRLVAFRDAEQVIGEVMEKDMPLPCNIPGWDGMAASRIAAVLLDWAGGTAAESAPSPSK